MKFYIVDKTDPIISAYKKIYPAMFEENDIPEEIQKQLKYPQLLYNVQAETLRVYHKMFYIEKVIFGHLLHMENQHQKPKQLH